MFEAICRGSVDSPKISALIAVFCCGKHVIIYTVYLVQRLHDFTFHPVGGSAFLLPSFWMLPTRETVDLG